MSEIKATFAGKNIIVYSPKDGKQYSSEDIARYLRKFNLGKALRFIGKLSHQLNTPQGIHYIYGVPVSNGVLSYLSMLLIENSNDYRSEDMTIDNLLTAIDMFFGLPDPFQEDGENPQGCFIRFGASQFDYDREVRHLLPRTFLLYGSLWDKVLGDGQVNVSAAIKEISGLSFLEILVLGFTFSKISEKGFFHLYQECNEKNAFLRKTFSVDKQEVFFDWLSCGYKDFRSLSKADLPPSINYDKFRFNPLFLKPAIIPDRNFKPGFPQVYLTPIPSLVFEKVTRGLYFSLTDYFTSNKGNPFRSAFGCVFQEYVGLLLKKVFGEENVKSERRYGVKGKPKDTPDWFVIYNGLAVLIEVKQTGLYLNAKKWGKLEEVQRNLAQGIGSGVSQMWRFERDVKDGLCTLPDELNKIRIVERLIVTYDRPYFLNSILKDEVRKLYPSIPEVYHWHTTAVEELEYFLGIVGTKLITALTEKRLDRQGNDMDFKDYFSRRYPGYNCVNPYLDSVYADFLNSLGFSGEEIVRRFSK